LFAHSGQFGRLGMALRQVLRVFGVRWLLKPFTFHYCSFLLHMVFAHHHPANDLVGALRSLL
jgi:hypothetical protein